MTHSLALALTASLAAGDGLDRCNAVWDSPSKGSAGSMPLGNGDVGVNLWVESGGDLVLLISKTDAWDAHCRLLKLGRVRVKLTPNPFAEGLGFRQELKLRQGCVRIVAGQAGRAVTIDVWVDARRNVVRVETTAEKPVSARAELEIWRDKPTVLTGKARDSARGVLGGGYPLKVPADRLVEARDRVVWYHRNVESCYPITMKVQGLADLAGMIPDPLLGRTFGGAMIGDGLAKAGPTTLKTPRPAKRFALAIHALTKCPATEDQWLAELGRQIAAGRPGDRSAHEAWWKAFWRRSWIYASGSAQLAGARLGTNDLPLRIGAGGAGGNRFRGEIARPMVFRRALDAKEIAALAAGKDESLARDEALVGAWSFEKLKDNVFPARGAAKLPAKVVGRVAVADAPAGKAVRLDGTGHLEVAHARGVNLRDAVTLAAWVCPAGGGAGDGRILDKSRVGTDNGYLLDTYPGGTSLRMITAPATLIHKNCLKVGTWSHVAGVFDSAGRVVLYVDGLAVAAKTVGGSLDLVTRTYQLQRFVNACAGRGAMPIKFNGTIFTVDGPGYGPDYRRWGGCYWWQNTRLPYWSMIPCGDWDLAEPLFEMYRRMLALRKAVTRTYYKHDGAFFAETMYFWGTPCNDDHRWNRGNNPDHLMLNRYIRREWQGGLEVTEMMLDRYDYTRDEQFARSTLLPHAEAVLTFYDKHYGREADGTLRIDPAQSLETWWRAVNPMPEVAGLHAVLPRLLALPKGLVSPERRAAWTKLAGQLPPIPTREVDGKDALAAAAEFSDKHNSENPELYAVFPYRLFGLARPGLDVARRAFDARLHRHGRGWDQDTIQSAMLGLSATAGQLIVRRSAAKHAPSRFEAFWGPNFDWVPDQDHGANNMMGLQAMLLQPVAGKVLLLPAWPEGWDVHFKLHAPQQTTVECVYRNGSVERLVVMPPERAKDVVRIDTTETRQEN